jgi:hypothetical protein
VGIAFLLGAWTHPKILLKKRRLQMSDPQWDAWAEHMKETMLDDISIAISKVHIGKVEELKELKKEFIGRCDSAIAFKQSTGDIKNCKSLEEWLKKWQGSTDDDMAYQMAIDHFNGGQK